MARNTNKDYRIGSVKNRTQIHNHKTNLYEKVDNNTGRIISIKTTGGKYKGVAMYKDKRR